LTIILANVNRFPKFFHQLIRAKIIYSMYTHKDFHFTCNTLLHYLVKFASERSNQIFTLNVTINMLN